MSITKAQAGQLKKAIQQVKMADYDEGVAEDMDDPKYKKLRKKATEMHQRLDAYIDQLTEPPKKNS